MAKPASSSDHLIQCLRKLRPEGALGFEGLIRLLMEAWTGRRFRLARGGEQHGHDAMNDPGPLAPTILVECKRYEEDNKPPTRDLMGEVGQALTQFPSLDLWVLVGTTEFGSNSLDKVSQLATEHSVEMLVVDTRQGGGGDLELLCAAYPKITIDFLVKRAKADSALLTTRLDLIRAGQGYANSETALRAKLSGYLLGYDGARRRMADWLRRHVSERAEAMASFGQDLALRAQGITLIPRKAIFGALDGWWQAEPIHPFSLVGEEGSGKSWAAMAWLLNLMDQTDSPLIIPVTSNMVQGPERPAPAKLVAETLARTIGAEIGQTSVDWWLKRTFSWWRQVERPARPLVLFLLDGLNEAPGVAWRQFIGLARLQENRGHNSVLLTCRKPFWDEHLGLRAELDPAVVTEGYDPHELAQAVAGRVDLATLPGELRELMRRPRYCDLVAKHCATMIASGDFTVARLMFEDRVDRYRRKERHPFSPEEFDEVLRGLAKSHHQEWKDGRGEAGFGKRELRDLLPQDDPRALQEIIDGGVLTHIDDPAYPYRVEKGRLVYGLGMLLASDLRRLTTGFADAIQEWFEPQRDMDIKTEILGAAVFFSLPTKFPKYPEPQRRALLRAWLISRNMPTEQEAAIAAYLPDCAEDMLAEVDGFFTPSDDPIGNAQIRLGNALAVRRQDDRVLPALVQAAERWAGYVGDTRDGDPWAPQTTEFGVFQKVPFEDMRGSALQVFLAAIIQAGPRKPFILAYIRAALAAGFIQQHFIDDRTAWSLRLSDEEMEDWISPHLSRIAEVGQVAHPILCESVGSERMRVATEYHRFRNPSGETLPSIDRDIDHVAAKFSVNPDASLDERWEGKVGGHFGTLPVAERILSPYQTVTDHDFKQIEPVAAVVAPDALGQFLCSVLSSLPSRDVEKLFTICLSLPQMIAVAGPLELAAILSVQRRLESSASPGDDAYSAEADAFLAFAMRAPAIEASDIFLNRPGDALDLQQLHYWFRPQSPEIRQAIHARLLGESAPRRLGRLLFVAGCGPQPLTPEQREVVARCLIADDDNLRYSATLYTLNSKDPELIATVLGDTRSLMEQNGSVADRLQADILARHGQDIAFEVIAGRLPLPDLAFAVLVRGNRPAEVDALAARIDAAVHFVANGNLAQPDQENPDLIVKPKTLAGVTVNYFSHADLEPVVMPQDPAGLERLNALFSDQDSDYDNLQKANQCAMAFRAAGEQLNDPDFPVAALSAIRDRHPAMMTGWAEAAIRETAAAKRLRMLGAAFFQSLAAALVHDDPGLGFRLWKALRSQRHSLRIMIPGTGTDWMICLPFQAPDGPETDAVRKQVLDQAITDLEFLEIATAATACGHREWLRTAIKSHIAMKPLWRRGKGLALAALADLDDSAFDALVLAADVADTWVGDALPVLRTYHDHNCWARHWYRQFLTAPDKDKSYAGFVLFLKCADRRCRLWMREMETELANDPGFDEWRIRYRLTIDDTIAKAIEENEKARADKLFGLDFKKDEVIPYGLWLSPDIQIPAPRPS